MRAGGWYRRPPGLVWLIGLVVIPLLLAVIGYSLTDRSGPRQGAPSGPLPTLTERAAAPSGVALAPLSIVRNGDEITLDGEMPSAQAKRELLDTVLGSVGPDVDIIDTVEINPHIKALDFSSAGTFFDAVADIGDYSLVVGGDTVTLTGSAAAVDRDAVEDAAAAAWPHVNIVDAIETR